MVNYIFLTDIDGRNIYEQRRTFKEKKYKKLNFVKIYLLFDVFTKIYMELILRQNRLWSASGKVNLENNVGILKK